MGNVTIEDLRGDANRERSGDRCHGIEHHGPQQASIDRRCPDGPMPARPNKTPNLLRSVAQGVMYADGEPEGRPTLDVQVIDRHVKAGSALDVYR